MGKEIIAIAEALSNERAIPKDKIFEALELALATATKKKYTVDIDVRVEIDRKEGSFTTYRRWTVVDTNGPLENPAQQISLEAAQVEYPNISDGDIVEDEIESVTFDRITIQTAKQVLSQRVKTAEREQLIAEQRERLGHVVSATVKRPGRDFMILDLGNGAEGVLRRDQMIPHETFGRGDRIRVLLIDIKQDGKGPQLVCSRTAPEFLAELFRIEVPEIGDGVIEIMGVARDPGSRAKISVRSRDKRVDPRGACIGMRGARVMAVSNELSGERIDIVLWDENLAQYVTNAMEPAEVSRIVINDERHSIDIAVADDNLALAIGRNGQNVRLASQVLDWNLQVKAESAMDKELEAEAAQVVKFFVENLDIDEEFAQVLADAGFHTLDEVAYVPAAEFLEIEGIDEEIVNALQENARNAIARNEEKLKSEGADVLMQVPGIDTELALALAGKGIKTLEDLADQSIDDLLDLGVSEQRAGDMIMGARDRTWFKEEFEAKQAAARAAQEQFEAEQLALFNEQFTAVLQGEIMPSSDMEGEYGPNGEFIPGVHLPMGQFIPGVVTFEGRFIPGQFVPIDSFIEGKYDINGVFTPGSFDIEGNFTAADPNNVIARSIQEVVEGTAGGEQFNSEAQAEDLPQNAASSQMEE